MVDLSEQSAHRSIGIVLLWTARLLVIASHGAAVECKCASSGARDEIRCDVLLLEKCRNWGVLKCFDVRCSRNENLPPPVENIC